MGNCLKNNQISAQDHEHNETPLEPSEAKVDQIKTSPSSKLEAPRRGQRMKKKIRFKIEEKDDEGDRGSNGNSRSGTVRIRMVMTQQELKRMLRCKDDAQQHTSLEQLLGVMKLKGGRISEACEYDGDINSWKPALKSIPENSLIE